jgi:hypothetical protein
MGAFPTLQFVRRQENADAADRADQKKVWQNHFVAESFRGSCVDHASPRKTALNETDRQIGNGKTNSVHLSVLSRSDFEPTTSDGKFS